MEQDLNAADELLSRDFAPIPEMVELHARLDPSRRAIVQDDDSLTYAELDELLDRYAAALQRDGIREDDAVGLVASTTIEATCALLGTLRAGAVPVLMDASATREQVASVLDDSGARLVFVDAATIDCMPATPARLIELGTSDAWLPSRSTKPRRSNPTAGSRFDVIYSSGTTGAPKGIVHTHGSRWLEAKSWNSAGLFRSVSMIATPLHSNITLAMLISTIVFGGTAVLLREFDPRRYLLKAEQERATHTMLVPHQYQRIMAVPDFGRYDLRSFRFKSSTGAPFAAGLKADVLRRWPGALADIYCTTEGGGACLLLASLQTHKLHTVGQPTAASDIRLIDETGREVPRGGIGEVVGRSSLMVECSHGSRDASGTAAWHDAEGRRYVRHGDLGRFDDEGFLTLLGRKEDLLVSGGVKVHPRRIEAVALEHPGVIDAAVIGLPSEACGETPYAFFAVGDPEVTAEELVAWVNARLEGTQRLSGGEVTRDLPRTWAGKVLTRELRARIRA